MPSLNKDQIGRIISCPFEFISRLYIRNKQGKLVRLKLNAEQIKVVQALQSGKNIVIIKARQCGISTVLRAWQFWKAYASPNPIDCAVLSHTLKSANHIHKMDKLFYDKLPLQLKRKLSSETNRTLVFADTMASIGSFSAGGDGGLRSFTFTDLHISEFAFFEDPDELLATAASAVNDGQIVIESTAKHFGDAMHQLILKAQHGEADWTILEFYWHEHAENVATVPKDFKLTPDELDLQVRYGCSEAQLAWRRKEIGKSSPDKFRREHPACLDDCFSQNGNTYYTDEDLQFVNVVKVDPLENIVIHQYDRSDVYAIGCDVAQGVGRDYSVATVVSKELYAPVAIYRSNKISPTIFAKQIQDMSIAYGNAKVLVEQNNHGGIVINELKHLGFINFWKDDEGKDWNTTVKSKLIMHEELKSMISSGVVTDIDNITFSELRSLLIDDGGLAPDVPSNLPHHGDSVIALGLAIQCLKRVNRSTSTYLPGWIKKKKANRIKRDGAFISKRKY